MKSDFKDGKTPMDMSDFPYHAGDKLPGDITVLSVINGDENDSFGGYLVKPIVDVRGTKRIYGEPYVFECVPFKDRDGRHPVMDDANLPDGVMGIEIEHPVGNPWAQYVTFKTGREKGSRGMIPADFLEFVKGLNPEGEIPEPEVKADDAQTWTAGDDEYITENYNTMSDSEMAKVLEVSPSSLKRHRLDDLKLNKKTL
jgi:hypothetical protein